MLRDDQIPALQGLPSQWRYALTGGNDDSKVCFEAGWNTPGSGRPIDEVLRINNSPNQHETWKCRKVLGVGVVTGPESGGLLVIDFDGVGTQAIRAFRDHFHHNPSELPITLCNISGKKGRGKVYLKVPPHWWPQLQNRSASWKVDDRVVLEAMWMNASGTGRHAVICGDHPQTSDQLPLYYRWVEKGAPGVAEWATAPDWLLLGIIAKFDETVPNQDERRRAGEEDATPWERLTIRERCEIIEAALPFCPQRDGKGSGSYPEVRRILCGIIHEMGIEPTIELINSSDWDTKNDWGDTTAEKTIYSLSKSTVPKEQRARIGSLFHFARENGFSWPQWALPPLAPTQANVDELRKILNMMNTSSHDRTALATYSGRAWREFGVGGDDLYRLRLEHHLGTIVNKGARTMEEIIQSQRADNVYTDVIDGFLGRRVHVLAGGSHSGKTTLACFLANRVITGSSIDVDSTRHTTESPGRVLILTSDCSDQDMIRDLTLEGVEPDQSGERIRIASGTTFEDMIPIVDLLKSFKPDLVIMDCLTSMAVPGVKIGDPAYADPIRLLSRHNGIAWPKCAFVVLHHTSRDEPTRFSGTEQIKAACEELWLYYAPELLKWRKGSPRPVCGPTRHLSMEKSRSGYAGRHLCITRDAYQGVWQLTNPNAHDGSPLDNLTVRFRGVTDDEWRVASEWQEVLDLQFHPRSLRRYLHQLVGTVLESEIRRSKTRGVMVAHFRPRQAVRRSAKDMLTSKGDGINIV